MHFKHAKGGKGEKGEKGDKVVKGTPYRCGNRKATDKPGA